MRPALERQRVCWIAPPARCRAHARSGAGAGRATTTSRRSVRPNASRRRRCATSWRSRSSATATYVDIRVRANAFLHHMVRNIAGQPDRWSAAASAPPDGCAAVLAGPRPARWPGPRRRRRACISPASTTPPGSACHRVNFGVRVHGSRAVTWFEKIMPSRIKTERRSRSVPEGLWIKCPACDAVLYRAELERNLQVCPKCSHHMRIEARDRLDALPRRRARDASSRTRSSPRIRSSSATARSTATA